MRKGRAQNDDMVIILGGPVKAHIHPFRHGRMPVLPGNLFNLVLLDAADGNKRGWIIPGVVQQPDAGVFCLVLFSRDTHQQV